MIKKKNYNSLLITGICAIILGISLLIYSIASYSEIKLVTDKIDFDNLDNNNQISTSDKYYQYLSIWDTLNQKLEKNKNLPVKNLSCAYLDYTQHNIKSMYKLIYKSANEDTTRRSVVEGNIKTLSDMYKNYKTCRKTALYLDELDKMLDEIENSDEIFYQGRMETFLNGNRDIERVNSGSAVPDGEIQDEIYPQYEHQIIPQNQTNTNQQTPQIIKQTEQNEQKFKQVEQYIEPNQPQKTNYSEGKTYSLTYPQR